MIVVRGETYKFTLYKRKENSPYEWQEVPTLVFKGRPANNYEKKQYRIQQGVEGNSQSQLIISSNIPSSVNVKDKIIYLGKEWTVGSVGYYYDEARFVNAGILSNEFIRNKCPKGVTLI